MGSTWSYLDLTALGRQEEWEDSPEGYPPDPAVRVVDLARRTEPDGTRSTRPGGSPRRPCSGAAKALERQ